MSKALIIKLRGQRDEARASADTILAKMERGEDLADTEKTNLETLTSEATTLDARIKELTEMETARIEALNLDAKFDSLKTEKSTLQIHEQPKDLGSMFTESSIYTNYIQTPSGNSGVFTTEFALLDTISTGVIPVDHASEAAMPSHITPLLGAIGYEPVSGNAIDWIEWPETLPVAGLVAEGAVKPEATYAPVLRTGTLDKLAHHIPITREMLEDLPRVRSIVSNALLDGVRLKAEKDAVVALMGATIPPVTGSGAAGDTLLKMLRVGIATVQTKGYRPNAIALNPLDYADIDVELLGVTLAGARRESPVWGTTIIAVPELPAGTAYVGDFKAAMTLFDRRVTNVYMTDSHADEFTSNILRILAEARLKSVVQRPNALVEVTVGAVAARGGTGSPQQQQGSQQQQQQQQGSSQKK